MEIKRKMQSLPLSHMAAHPSQSLSQFPKHEATWSITTPRPHASPSQGFPPPLPPSEFHHTICLYPWILLGGERQSESFAQKPNTFTRSGKT